MCLQKSIVTSKLNSNLPEECLDTCLIVYPNLFQIDRKIDYSWDLIHTACAKPVVHAIRLIGLLCNPIKTTGDPLKVGGGGGEDTVNFFS